MEQQIAPTLWLPPGVCLLNPVPTMQFQPTSHMSAHHVTSQLLKQQMVAHAVPGANLMPNQPLFQPGHFLQQPAQNFFHIPGLTFENLLLPPSGKQTFEIQPPTAPLIELPCPPLNLHMDKQIHIPTTAAVLPPSDVTFQRHIMTSKIMKKKRISPSAKRRSRLRLIAFLESKRKQQISITDDNTKTLQTIDDEAATYTDDVTIPSSPDDITMSPKSHASTED